MIPNMNIDDEWIYIIIITLSNLWQARHDFNET